MLRHKTHTVCSATLRTYQVRKLSFVTRTTSAVPATGAKPLYTHCHWSIGERSLMDHNNKQEEETFRLPWTHDEEYYLRNYGKPEREPKEQPALFTPLKIRDLTLNNRIVVAPMCQYSSHDGFMNDWHLVHLGSMARGKPGLIIAEATAVSPEGRITPYCAGIWKDEQVGALKRVVTFSHSQGVPIGIQLHHAGRKASCLPPFPIKEANGRKNRSVIPVEQGGWDILGASALPWEEGDRVPTEMSKEDIKRVVQAFVAAAKRADEAGFDVVEIHGAHGYLISSFNSPVSNKRTDEYGGSFENRTRFCREVCTAVRTVWPENKPMFLRLSCTDWVDDEPQWDSEQTVALAKEVALLGVDVVHCSTGGQSPKQKISGAPSFQVPFAEDVKKQAPEVLSCAVGMITEASQANQIISEGRADLVALARAYISDPHWALHAASNLNAQVEWAPQMARGKEL